MACRQCKNLVLEKKLMSAMIEDESCRLQEGECINPITLDSYNIYDTQRPAYKEEDSLEMKAIKSYWEKYENENIIF